MATESAHGGTVASELQCGTKELEINAVHWSKQQIAFCAQPGRLKDREQEAGANLEKWERV